MRGLLITLAVLASGCTSAAVIGDQCDLNSDCADPLVCRSGRCRAECAEPRDCPLGAICLQLNEGRACRLPDEESCSSDADCPDDAPCVGRCRNSCSGDGECPGSSCVGDVCILPSEMSEVDAGGMDAGSADAGIEAGAVDANLSTPRDQCVAGPIDDCPAGMGCKWVQEFLDGGRVDYLTCQRIGTVGLCQECTIDTQCPRGSACHGVDGLMACTPICRADEGNGDCPDGFMCNVWAGRTAWGFCDDGCPVDGGT